MLRGTSASQLRRRRASPRNVRVAAAAAPRFVSAERPRRGRSRFVSAERPRRGVAATRLRGIAAAAPLPASDLRPGRRYRSNVDAAPSRRRASSASTVQPSCAGSGGAGSAELNGESMHAHAATGAAASPFRFHSRKSRARTHVSRTTNASSRSAASRPRIASPAPIAPSASAHSCRSIASSPRSPSTASSAGAAAASRSWPRTYLRDGRPRTIHAAPRDVRPRTIHVAPRGGAATRPRTIHVAATVPRRVLGPSTWQRRCRDVSSDHPRGSDGAATEYAATRRRPTACDDAATSSAGTRRRSPLQAWHSSARRADAHSCRKRAPCGAWRIPRSSAVRARARASASSACSYACLSQYAARMRCATA